MSDLIREQDYNNLFYKSLSYSLGISVGIQCMWDDLKGWRRASYKGAG